MKKLIFLSALLMILINGMAAYPVSANKPVKILFIGSSYFNFNKLPDLFQNLVFSTEHEIVTEHYIPSGQYLADHASNIITEKIIQLDKWDYVVLQGVGSQVAYPDKITHHPVYPSLRLLKEKILKNHPSTRIIFCLPWAFEDGMSWKEGWSDQYKDMQVKIDSVTRLYAHELDLLVAPVGHTWHLVLEEKKFPLHYLHQSDWNHPTMKGSYLMACVIFSTIFQESTEGNSYGADLSSEEVKYFQRVASGNVLDNLEHWSIPKINR